MNSNPNPWGECNLLSFKNLQVQFYTKLHKKACCYFIIYMPNTSHKVKLKFWPHACAICNLLLCSNFALMLHEKLLYTFFYIIIHFWLGRIKTKFKFYSWMTTCHLTSAFLWCLNLFQVISMMFQIITFHS